MKDTDFYFIAGLLKDRSGLFLTPEKIYLLDSRLLPIARKHGFPGLGELFNALRSGGNEAIAGEVVDAMTTNETSFFRDHHPFEAFRKHILPALIKRRENQRALRIWSAACSTGQEPYSLAMILRDDFPQLAGWRIEILGTDLSPSVLERARAGTYSTFEVQRGMPIKLLLRHFEEAPGGWRIRDELRRDIRFSSINLLNSITALGTFDIVFCRNVLIYFDRPTKSAVLDKIAGRLAPDGALFLGGSESIFGICERFSELQGLRGVYAHATAAAERASGQPPKEPNRIATRVA